MHKQSRGPRNDSLIHVGNFHVYQKYIRTYAYDAYTTHGRGKVNHRVVPQGRMKLPPAGGRLSVPQGRTKEGQRSDLLNERALSHGGVLSRVSVRERAVLRKLYGVKCYILRKMKRQYCIT